MAKNIKKISIAAMDKIIKENFPNTATEQWFDTEIIIQRTLPFSEMLAFVDSVVSNCVQEDIGYLPEMKDFFIRYNLLTRYANFNLPNKLEHCYSIVYGTDATELVMKNVNISQFNSILDAIDRKIEYLCDSNVSAIEKQMRNVVASFEEMEKKTEAMFSGINADDIAKITTAFVENGLNEERLVKAYVESQRESSEDKSEK